MPGLYSSQGEDLRYVLTASTSPTSTTTASRFSAAGTLLGLFGDAGDAPARLERPTDVAVAEDGTIYVVVVGHDRTTVFLEQNRNKIGAGSLLKRKVIHD